MAEATHAVRKSVAGAPAADRAKRSDTEPAPQSGPRDRLSRLSRTLNAGPGVRQLKAIGGVIQRVKNVVDPRTGQEVDIHGLPTEDLKALALAFGASASSSASVQQQEVIDEIQSRKSEKAKALPPNAGLLAGAGGLAIMAQNAARSGTTASSQELTPITGTTAKNEAHAKKLLTSAAGSVAGAAVSLATGGISGKVQAGAAALGATVKAARLEALRKKTQAAASKQTNSNAIRPFAELDRALGDAQKIFGKLAAAYTAGAIIPGSGSAAELATEADLARAKAEVNRLALGNFPLALDAAAILGVAVTPESGGTYGSLGESTPLRAASSSSSSSSSASASADMSLDEFYAS